MVEHHNTSSGGEDDFAAMFEESLRREEIKEGAIVHGRVIQLNKDHVVIDIGYKSEGQVPIEEFTGPDGNVKSVRRHLGGDGQPDRTAKPSG